MLSPGPFRADQLHSGDPYELSNGHALHIPPTDARRAEARTAGVIVITTTTSYPVGIDAGLVFNDGKNLRAPDLDVGADLDTPGWIRDAPPLAIEYAGVGQNEAELEQKVSELLAFGTRVIWIVRLTGPLRVEVREPGIPPRIVDTDGELTAPGILERPIAVRALIDREVAVEAALHNILARKGYRDLDAVRQEGIEMGRHQELRHSLAAARKTLVDQFAARGWTVAPTLHARIDACTDLPLLFRWMTQVGAAPDIETVLR